MFFWKIWCNTLNISILLEMIVFYLICIFRREFSFDCWRVRTETVVVVLFFFVTELSNEASTSTMTQVTLSHSNVDLFQERTTSSPTPFISVTNRKVDRRRSAPRSSTSRNRTHIFDTITEVSENSEQNERNSVNSHLNLETRPTLRRSISTSHIECISHFHNTSSLLSKLFLLLTNSCSCVVKVNLNSQCRICCYLENEKDSDFSQLHPVDGSYNEFSLFWSYLKLLFAFG